MRGERFRTFSSGSRAPRATFCWGAFDSPFQHRSLFQSCALGYRKIQRAVKRGRASRGTNFQSDPGGGEVQVLEDPGVSAGGSSGVWGVWRFAPEKVAVRVNVLKCGVSFLTRPCSEAMGDHNDARETAETEANHGIKPHGTMTRRSYPYMVLRSGWIRQRLH